jgi:hypothetical protein
MPKMVGVGEHRSRDTVEALSGLLEDAKRGDVLGIAFTAILKRRRMSYGITGEAYEDAILTLGQIQVLAMALQERIREQM